MGSENPTIYLGEIFLFHHREKTATYDTCHFNCKHIKIMISLVKNTNIILSAQFWEFFHKHFAKQEY